jgi:hypothetical protein
MSYWFKIVKRLPSGTIFPEIHRARSNDEAHVMRKSFISRSPPNSIVQVSKIFKDTERELPMLEEYIPGQFQKIQKEVRERRQEQ